MPTRTARAAWRTEPRWAADPWRTKMPVTPAVTSRTPPTERSRVTVRRWRPTSAQRARRALSAWRQTRATAGADEHGRPEVGLGAAAQVDVAHEDQGDDDHEEQGDYLALVRFARDESAAAVGAGLGGDEGRRLLCLHSPDAQRHEEPEGGVQQRAEAVGHEQADEGEPDPDDGQPEMPGEPPRHPTEPASVAAAVELARRPRFDDGCCCGFRHDTDIHTGAGAGASGSFPHSPLIFGPRKAVRGSNAPRARSQGRYQGPTRVEPAAVTAPRPSPWTHDRSRARRDGSGTRLRPAPPQGAGPQDAAPAADAGAAGPGAGGTDAAGPTHRFRRDRRHKSLAGGAPLRTAVRHGPGDLPDHARGPLRDRRHRPDLLRLRLALRPLRGRGGERGAQAADRPGGRPRAGGGALRPGRLRGLPHHAAQRRGADLRRRPLPAPRGRRVLVAAPQGPRTGPAVGTGRRGRPAGGQGTADHVHLALLVARPHRQGRHPRRRDGLHVGPAGLRGARHRGGRQHRPRHPGPPRPRHRGRPALLVRADPRPPRHRRLGVPPRPCSPVSSEPG